ncbi:hypothetical protein ADIAG_00146 [Paeniglutamicibacter gangotriensis Lz1y]|uniref:Integral membrane protein n=1 Tax=Paeniglutamicibacter gangotriensis Lz1y TaxID=1276920 RepID=M7NNK9_9MICC|nr:hypothetical protein ADIAG_00146 [Paeniglutamicibacter gangotriensis Lz1y]
MSRPSGNRGLGSGAVQNFFTIALRSSWRWLAMLMLLVSAAAHLPVVGPGLTDAVYVGVLFIMLILADFVLIVRLWIHDSPAIWVLMATITGLALLAYVLSRTVGLPQSSDYIGDWVSLPGLASIASEAVGCIVAFLVLVRLFSNAHRPGQVGPAAR